MPVEPSASDDQDPLDVLSRELDKTNASLERAHERHQTILVRLGARAPSPTKVPHRVPRPDFGSGAYRGKDQVGELQRAVDEAKQALADLRDENSNLESQCDMVFPERPFAERPLGFLIILLVILAAIGGLVWLSMQFGPAGGGAMTTACLLIYLLVRVFRTDKSDRE